MIDDDPATDLVAEEDDVVRLDERVELPALQQLLHELELLLRVEVAAALTDSSSFSSCQDRVRPPSAAAAAATRHAVSPGTGLPHQVEQVADRWVCVRAG